MSMTVEQFYSRYIASNRFVYKYGGHGTTLNKVEWINNSGTVTSSQTGLGIDCKGFLNLWNLAQGINIPEMSTSTIFNSKGALTSLGEKYYTQASLENVQVGDVLTFNRHVAVVTGVSGSVITISQAWASGVNSYEIEANAALINVRQANPLLGVIRPKPEFSTGEQPLIAEQRLMELHSKANAAIEANQPSVRRDTQGTRTLTFFDLNTESLGSGPSVFGQATTPLSIAELTTEQRVALFTMNDAQFTLAAIRLSTIEAGDKYAILYDSKGTYIGYGYGQVRKNENKEVTHLGRYQMNWQWMQELGYVKQSTHEFTDKAKRELDVSDLGEFLASRDAQNKVLRSIFEIISARIVQNGLDAHIWNTRVRSLI